MIQTGILRLAGWFLAGALAACGADVTGSWTGQMGREGEGPVITFKLKQAEGKLTGTATGPQGDPLDINEGKVEGDKISFTVSFNGTTIRHDGAVKGDEIKLMVKPDQGDFPAAEMTLKRAK
jgi:hypothetical protein